MLTSNDEAWGKLFSDTGILSGIEADGVAYINAKTMKKYREPRLMAKIDTIEMLPQIFLENNLSILPVKNGEYAVFQDPHHQSFFKFPSDIDSIPISYHKPATSIANFDSFQTLNSLNEAQALDTALISSIIRDFTDEKEIWLTIRGRQFTQDFQVFVPRLEKSIDVSKVQIEIDAGYETENAIYLFEAKIGKRENFNIRQLLYPYLEWKNRTAKPIIPIFFYFTNGFYYLFEFALGNSLEPKGIIKQAGYTLSEIEEFNLERIFREGTPNNSLTIGIPFPQADDLNKVIDTVSLIRQGFTNKQELADVLEFDERQGDYYANAARYLGFLDRDNVNFSVTESGKQLLSLPSPSKRAEYVTKQLANRPVFYTVFHELLKNNLNIESLDSIDIPLIIENQTDLSGSTPERRASTVRQWVKWIYEYAG